MNSDVAISGRRLPDPCGSHATISIGIRPSDETKGRLWFFFDDGIERGEVVVRLLQGFLVVAVQYQRWRSTAYEDIRSIK
jgi:hypothetical protein